MDASPQLLREVEFREQWRGYSPDEVDDFLERLAVALEQLHERLRDANDRATRAERTVVDHTDDDELRRTLVLAQRTASAAVKEAKAEADHLVGDARSRAQELVSEAEARAARLHADIDAREADELRSLADRRSDLEEEIVTLATYVETARAQLRDELREQLAWLESPERQRPPAPAARVAVAPGAGPGRGAAQVGEDTVDASAGRRLALAPTPEEGDGDDEVLDPTGAYDVLADQLDDDEIEGGDGVQADPEDDLVDEADDLVDADDADDADDEDADDGAVAAADEGDAAGEVEDEVEQVDNADEGSSSTPPVDGLGRRPPRLVDPLDTDADEPPPAPERLALVDVREPVGAPRASAAADDDDPFLAELRRAVTDPEPLGPRDEDDVRIYDQDLSPAPRGRRRRRRS